MNRHLIIGNLVRDPENGITESGANWCRFVVAVNKRYHREGEPEADYIRVTCWRGLAENCVKYLRKGRKVACTGESTAYAWIGRDGSAKGQIELTAMDVEFIGSGRAADGGYSGAPQEPGWVSRSGDGSGDGYPEGSGAEAYPEADPETGEIRKADGGRQVNFTEVQTDEDELPF